ncbi:hypothetical protein MTO96_029582 [Rhipicephalus appendiculatus]
MTRFIPVRPCAHSRRSSLPTRDRVLQAQPNQGKVMACVSADRASAHFVQSGGFTHFADRRSVHRARLNLLPLNGAAFWGSPDRDQRCGPAATSARPYPTCCVTG